MTKKDEELDFENWIYNDPFNQITHFITIVLFLLLGVT